MKEVDKNMNFFTWVGFFKEKDEQDFHHDGWAKKAGEERGDY